MVETIEDINSKVWNKDDTVKVQGDRQQMRYEVLLVCGSRKAGRFKIKEDR